jgi:hypothetical protein
MLTSLSKNTKHHHIHFYCLDKETYELINGLKLELNLTVELVESNVSSNFEAYNSPTFFTISHIKIHLIKQALLKYNFIHFIDSDVVCVKEPTAEFYDKYSAYDIVFQYDCGFDAPDSPHWHMFHTWACTGNWTLRHTPETISILDSIIEYSVKYPNLNDQECLKRYFDDKNIKDVRCDDKAKMYVYPYDVYMNGFSIRENIFGIENAYFIHANHVCGSSSKKSLLQKINSWYV